MLYNNVHASHECFPFVPFFYVVVVHNDTQVQLPFFSVVGVHNDTQVQLNPTHSSFAGAWTCGTGGTGVVVSGVSSPAVLLLFSTFVG